MRRKAQPAPVRSDRRIVFMALNELLAAARNPKHHDLAAIEGSVSRFGYVEPVVLDERTGRLVAGHGRVDALRRLREAGGEPPEGVRRGRGGAWLVPVLRGWSSRTDREAEAYLLASNQTTIAGGWNDEALEQMLRELVHGEGPDALLGTGFGPADLEALLAASPVVELEGEASAGASLAERFGVPPFTVLDARQGYWQARKAAWLALGIRSEEGRGENLLGMSDTVLEPDPAKRSRARRLTFVAGSRPAGQLDPVSSSIAGTAAGGTSVFDPVLCELVYRWFSPEGGAVLDPFAGGSVRGVVAAKLGRRYTGVELRAEQVAANREQAQSILQGGQLIRNQQVEQLVTDADALTPIERLGDIWLKRDDLFELGGARGGKARAARAFLLNAVAKGCTTAGHRLSPMVSRVARVAEALGLPCRVHVADARTPGTEELDAEEHGATVVRHRPGYLSLLKARAAADAKARGWACVPFGLECREYFDTTRAQVANLPADVERIVVPVGSGLSLAGVLAGLEDAGRRTPVLGVCVGADPSKRLEAWAPRGWRKRVKLVESGSAFEKSAPVTTWWGVELDPLYEAKAAAHVRPGDLLWVIARRATATATVPAVEATEGKGVTPPTWLQGDSRDIGAMLDDRFDLVFSCPPYGSLERYSDDPRDLSTLDHAAFLQAYARVVRESVALLRPNRFAVFVVGDFRDGRGFYRNFVADTIAAFERAGARLYNEAVLVTMVGSLSLRVGRQFSGYRKLGKAHQNVLVFFKGDPKRVPAELGDVEVPPVLGA